MSLKEKIPIVIFDNQCFLCVKFAKMINFFSKGKIRIIGHYSKKGQEIREEILDESALDMFWFVTERNAYGGRAAIIPLVKTIIFSKNREKVVEIDETCCGKECKTPKAVFLRSASLLSKSKKIKIS